MSETTVAITSAFTHDKKSQQEVLAALEGHGADIPTVEQPIRTEKDAAVGENPATNDGASVDRSSPLSSNTTRTEKVEDEEAKTIGRSSENREGNVRYRDVEPADSNVVDWDGPDDPENPVNWKGSLKWTNIGTISTITFIT